MATREALEAGRRKVRAREAVIAALRPLGDGMFPAWRTIVALERAAIKVGEVRERGRKRRKAARP